MIKKRIKSIIQKVLYLYPGKDLYLLALKYGTDKRGHGYIKTYEQLFKPIRNNKLNILEIGVGGFNNPNKGGSSLRMWKEYFKKSIIYSIDIHDKSKLEENRIKIFKGSQNDSSFLRNIETQIGPIDIIIDDGSHISEHILTSFNTLFPLLKQGGLYIIEDTHTSYLPQFGGEYKYLNNNRTSMGYFKDLTDGLNYEYIPKRTPSFFDQNITSISFYSKMIVIHRGKNKHSLTKYNQAEIKKAKEADRVK